MRFKDHHGTPVALTEQRSHPELVELRIALFQPKVARIVMSREQAAKVGRALLAFGGTGKLPKYTAT